MVIGRVISTPEAAAAKAGDAMPVALKAEYVKTSNGVPNLPNKSQASRHSALRRLTLERLGEMYNGMLMADPLLMV
jgi:hypothetical protein